MTKRLHIFHVFSTFCAGGPQVRTCVIMNALGPEFLHTVTATDGNFAAVSKINPDVSCRTLPPPAGKGSPFYALSLSKTLRTVRPDLLVTYNWGAIDAVLAARIAPVCPTIHAEDGFGSDEAAGLKWRRVWMRRLVLNGVQSVVVPSKTLQAIALKRYRIRSDKVFRIPNGVDIDRFCPSRNDAWRASHGISPATLLFGYVGRLGAEKNLEMMIRAFGSLRLVAAKLAIIGSGPCRSQLEEMVRELGLGERVLFIGHIDDPAPCYQALDVFLMSSITEQMSIALLEAMAVGLPILCTDVGDSSEILGNPGPPAVVPSRDADAYLKSLGEIGANSELRVRLGTLNRTRCVEHYSQHRMVDTYRSLYSNAAAEHAKSR